MRSAVVVVAGAASLALTSCSLQTGPATGVTQTSARLTAYGSTDDTPASYHFEYARDASDLGTARGQRTPQRGPIPPHTGSDGAPVAFGETVTGLGPGRVFAFRVCGRDGRISFDLCAAPQWFFTVPTAAQDSVRGGYDEGISGGRGSVDAAGTATGADADGLLEDADYPHLAFRGRVTCLAVHGTRAVVGAVGTVGDPTGGGAPAPAAWKVVVVDDPAGDRWIRQSTGARPDCSTADLTAPTRTGVAAEVHDASP